MSETVCNCQSEADIHGERKEGRERTKQNHIDIEKKGEINILYVRFFNQYCIPISLKSHVSIYSNYEVKGSIKINNEVINQIGKYNKDESVKFLGIHIDKHLTLKEHINVISSKISRAIFAIIESNISCHINH